MERLSENLIQLRRSVEHIVTTEIAPRAEQVDRECLWPAHSLQALGKAGLLGLQVPQAQGGHGQGLLALSLLMQTIARACPSSALCFGMHCVGTAVITAKATSYQRERYLREIAQGKHITTLALSEQGTGANFYLPETTLEAEGDAFLVNGTKHFVTNGGHADSYVISAASVAPNQGGDFSCLVVDQDTPNMEWLAPWQGFGMRGNSSRGVRLDNARVAAHNLLGEEGDQIWYVFEVVAPYFLMAMAGTYLGIAQSALDAAGEHLRSRRHSHTGESLRHLNAVQQRYADMWIAIEKTRSLLEMAAQRGDRGDPEALPYILSCKADAAETAVYAANEAMTLCGGMAYRENSRVSQMLRDARAGHVMAPTTDMLKAWTGRSLLGLPLL